ncbi:glycoside hydrolase [Cercophora newfieldiana]|uniref:lytic cellulose monooxygenase (C4-dehydrogenating) n=1 Tax=Cercophora newfieldiana TaxID=92897 RepID=A0AA40CST4_9PEZI|nr:glycoside hydrolase [Cercophora newfieldiana]
MKLLSLLLAASAGVEAHYRFSKIVVDGVAEAKEWGAVRQTKSYQGNQGVTDINSVDLRCHQMRSGTTTATVVAGEKLGFVANAQVTHFGPVSFYMARAPDSADLNTWDGSGQVWAKVAVIDAVKSGSGWEWPAYNKQIVDFTIPKSIPDGKYLVRVESIALHQAQSAGGAQIYVSCAQVQVTGGGSGTPSPLVSIPGAYRANDPGLIWSYYPVKTQYTAPGPKVWEG